jgi:hypothetical protein
MMEISKSVYEGSMPGAELYREPMKYIAAVSSRITQVNPASHAPEILSSIDQLHGLMLAKKTAKT